MKTGYGFGTGFAASTLFRIGFQAMPNANQQLAAVLVPAIFWYLPLVIAATWNLFIEIGRRRRDEEMVARLIALRDGFGPVLLGLAVGTVWFIVFPVRE